jgi:methylenetetrahydrofolate dehydrogenase (NADP+) / methenyltetrahydrofolate cyclohydrolase
VTGLILDGRSLALKIEGKLVERISHLKNIKKALTPILATILVGDDPASTTYVKMKASACQRIGMDSLKVVLPQSTSTAELLAIIDRLNADPDVHGILLQHPVPAQINERHCFDRINIGKDVDGVTSQGFGKMALGEPAYGSATPMGIMHLLTHYQVPVSGQHAVVIGRSPILGKPMAMMLLNADATVTICHSRTRNLDDIVNSADIIVGAVGKPEFIKGKWIRDGAVVVDAGYHPGGIGDIDVKSDDVIDRCSAFTPVPGGVGPMTIAMLISQTVDAAEKPYDR